MDPRDPRAAGDDLPPQRLPENGSEWDRQQEPGDRQQKQPEERDHPRSLPAPDPERYGPVAPEPAWGGRSFSRERFLLHFLGAVVAAQYAFLFWGAIICADFSRYRADKGLPPLTAEQNPGCRSIAERLSTVMELSISTVLALLAGKGFDAHRRP